jgi:uncharacterized protein YggE
MKRMHYLSTFLAGVLLSLAIAAWLPQVWAAPAPTGPDGTAESATSGDVCQSDRSVHVTGTAVVNVVPDRVLIQLGVVSTDTSPERVLATNTEAIQHVIDAVRELGVPDKGIATDRYIIRPVYDDYDSLMPTGYRIDNMVAITLEDVDKTSEVIMAALKAGANQMQDVQFYTSQLRRYRDQAREMAMKAAREKAEALVKTGGAQLGCLMEINENSWSSYYGSWWGGRERAMWTQNVVQNAPAGDQSLSDEVPISVGQIAVRAEVTAKFSLKSD